MCWNNVTTLLVCLFDELFTMRVVAEDTLNHHDIAHELYLRGVF